MPLTLSGRCKMVFLFLIAGRLVCAQELPLVEAKGGSQEVNWPEIKKQEEANPGAGFFYCDCCQGVVPVSATSQLAAQGTKNYSILNLSDSDPMTAWVEGKPGYGIGESFTVEAPAVNSIYNGYQSTPASWKNNSRVKKFKVYSDNQPLCYLLLKDAMGEQIFDLPLEHTATHHQFKFEIAEVYKGLKWDDVAISHIDWVGCCMASETPVTLAGNGVKKVGELQGEETIMTIDINTGVVSGTVVGHLAAQVHVTLLQVVAGSHQILITPDHPLYIKGPGFISLSAVKVSRRYDRYKQLNGLEVLVWDDENRSHFEKISHVEKLSGEFKTYTLKGLPKGSAYVAGGFVTTSY